MKFVNACSTLLLSVALFFEREAGYHVVSLALITAGIVLSDPSRRAQAAHDLIILRDGGVGEVDGWEEECGACRSGWVERLV